jgi:hypothetical protein
MYRNLGIGTRTPFSDWQKRVRCRRGPWLEPTVRPPPQHSTSSSKRPSWRDQQPIPSRPEVDKALVERMKQVARRLLDESKDVRAALLESARAQLAA